MSPGAAALAIAARLLARTPRTAASRRARAWVLGLLVGAALWEFLARPLLAARGVAVPGLDPAFFEVLGGLS